MEILSSKCKELGSPDVVLMLIENFSNLKTMKTSFEKLPPKSADVAVLLCSSEPLEAKFTEISDISQVSSRLIQSGYLNWINCIQALAPSLKNNGILLAVVSAYGSVPEELQTFYTASTRGLRGFLKGLSYENKFKLRIVETKNFHTDISKLRINADNKLVESTKSSREFPSHESVAEEVFQVVTYQEPVEEKRLARTQSQKAALAITSLFKPRGRSVTSTPKQSD